MKSNRAPAIRSPFEEDGRPGVVHRCRLSTKHGHRLTLIRTCSRHRPRRHTLAGPLTTTRRARSTIAPPPPTKNRRTRYDVRPARANDSARRHIRQNQQMRKLQSSRHCVGQRLGWRPPAACLLLVMVAAACEGDNGSSAASSSTTAPAGATSSISTTAPTTTTQTTGAPRSKEFGTGAYVEGAGQWLTAPAEPTTKRLIGSCTSLADQAGRRTASGSGATSVTLSGSGAQRRTRTGAHLREPGRRRLGSRPPRGRYDGKAFTASVVTADLTGDGNKKILVKLKSADEDISDGGLDPPTQVDVVEPTGVIVVHLVLGAGRSGEPDAARSSAARTRSPRLFNELCPDRPLRVRLIAYRDGAWRVVDEGCRGPTC